MVSKNKHKVEKALQDALIFCQKGQLIEAKNIYKKLIKVIPANDEMLANFGTVELQLGNTEYAIELLDRSLLINPNQPNILNNLGNYYLERGNTQKSIKYLDKAISLNSENFSALYNKGRALTTINKIDDAINCYLKATRVNPQDKLVHLNLGFVFNLNKSFDKAINEYNIVINLDENSVEAYFNRGITYANKGNQQKAIDDYSAAIKIDHNPRYIFNRAASYEKLDKFSEAIADYTKIINLNSSLKDTSKAYCRRGDLQNQNDNTESGMHDIKLAIDLQPDNSDYYNDYANGFKKLNQNEKAKEFYKYSIKLQPENYRSKTNLSYLELSLQNYSEAWELHESRWMVPNVKLNPLITTKPKLDNFDIQGKKILIWGEQGLGDHIIYSTMLSDAFKTSNQFICAIDGRLLDLYKRSFEDFKNVAFMDNVENEDLYDYHLPIASLGKFFRRSINDFSNQKIPLLEADKKYSKILKNKIKSNKRYICGISWISKSPLFGKKKSMCLEDLKSILSLPDIDFVDLQYGDTKKEKKEFKDNFGIQLVEISDIDKFNEIDKLSSLINACDFVITTSNVTAHIAGALNKKTYLFVPFTDGKLWYWGIKDKSCLWYPSIRILRSENHLGWDQPICNLKDLLSQEIGCERDS
jgi:tetratricopeptide (TPR) repeat protein